MIIKVKTLVFCENFELGDVHVMARCVASFWLTDREDDSVLVCSFFLGIQFLGRVTVM